MMIDVAKVHERLSLFADAQNVQEISSLMRAHADELDCASFIYALRVPTTAFAAEDARVIQIRGYPEEWLDRYWTESYYAVDPVIDYCSNHVLPIEWTQLVPRMSARGRWMMNEAAELGLRTGVTMPVHGPGGELGILSFARESKRAPTQIAVKHARMTAQLVALYAHEAVRRISNIATETRPAVQLSDRERECLRWAADGKTSWEISKLFNISERTVNFHFDNTVAKLNAGNRQHAIAKAIVTKILRPRPF